MIDLMPEADANYEVVFPYLVADIVSKKKRENALTEPELRLVVQNAFKLAVHKVALDTEDYKISLLVNIQADQQQYPLAIPSGFAFLKAIAVQNRMACYDQRNLIEEGQLLLYTVPKQPIPRAFILDIAIYPLMTSDRCSFSSRFINRYYLLIYLNIKWQLVNQNAQLWAGTFGQIQTLASEYSQQLTKAKLTQFSGPIRLGYEKLSHAR